MSWGLCIGAQQGQQKEEEEEQGEVVRLGGSGAWGAAEVNREREGECEGEAAGG
jgi:hypothetical protein